MTPGARRGRARDRRPVPASRAGSSPSGTSPPACVSCPSRAPSAATPSRATRSPCCGPCRPWPTATAPPWCCCTTSTGSSATRRWCRPPSPSWSPASSSAPSSSCWPRWCSCPSSWRSSSSSSSTPCPTAPSWRSIARGVTADNPEEMPQGEDLQRVLDAAAGLTRYEAEGAFALSLTRHNALRPESIWELKAQALKKNNLLTLHRGGERFDALGGLANLKDFCRRALRPGPGRQAARGLAAGRRPAAGKSAFCKSPGQRDGPADAAAGRRRADGAAWSAQTEQNVRQALKVADAMSPASCSATRSRRRCPASAAAGDSGVATRLFGTLLTWLSRPHLATSSSSAPSNDISKLPPEFARAERFDGVFFLDLPDGAGEGRYLVACTGRLFGIPESRPGPTTPSWTGAEIKSCCRLAALLDVHADAGGAPRRAGGRDRGRAGRAPAVLGQRPLPVGFFPGRLPPRRRDRPQGRPPRPARRQQQLTDADVLFLIPDGPGRSFSGAVGPSSFRGDP